MIRSELVARLAAQNPHSYGYEAEWMVPAILDHAADAPVDGDRVALCGLGPFDVRHREARAGRNPRNGITAEADAETIVLFKPGKQMRVLLNAGAAPLAAVQEPSRAL